ncbi:hypothetical protein BKG82_07815 [Mycobacteroides chelonae]|uniref:Uncharacterized protein n=1 Tax=Mycobacteroides chelonae TaxID=1774 RepID=A0A1S1LVE8_MYCCH|nr:hypothetical protein BKG82_07815 [Mycobacteroides chelonae]
MDQDAKTWQLAVAERVGRAISDYRRRYNLTAQAISERTAALGYPISRIAVSKIENNNRAGKLDVAELIVLAAAMNTPPLALLYPELPDGEVDMLPGQAVSSIVAARWFSGEISRSSIEGATDPRQIDDEHDNMRRISLSRRRHMLQSSIALRERVEAMSRDQLTTFVDANPAAIRSLTDLNRADLDRLTEEMASRGWEVGKDA